MAAVSKLVSKASAAADVLPLILLLVVVEVVVTGTVVAKLNPCMGSVPGGFKDGEYALACPPTGFDRCLEVPGTPALAVVPVSPVCGTVGGGGRGRPDPEGCGSSFVPGHFGSRRALG